MSVEMHACCRPIDAHFSAEKAEGLEQDLVSRGPPQETQLLITALTQQGVADMTVLDIGAGIGVLTEQLLIHGARSAVLVDISSAYLRAAEQRLTRLQLDGRVQFRLGDVVELADELGQSDIVTLDKVICCYPNYRELIEQSSSKAKRFYAASYPRDWLLPRVSIWFENFMRRLRGKPFRAYVHPVRSIEALLRQNGFELGSMQQTLFWRCVLFVRSQEPL
jgi:ubiquinone/menaquinone biosynthesis C-methylase UbiE